MTDRDRLVNSFCELVRIDSPSDEEEEVALHLVERLRGLGFQVDRDAHGNVIASEPGDDPLLLSAHMDTVEPGRGIKPQVLGDRIESDGTTILGGDCKAGVASILEALESLKDRNEARRPVQVVLTRGEEIGLVGASNLDYSMIRAREAVVFDGNGPVNHITGASPTYMRFDVTVKGRAAHAGVEPEKGLSAIRIAADIIGELPHGRLDEETTFNVGMISGGSVRNAVPAEATFGGEFRSRNTETLDLLRMQVTTTLEQARKRYQDAIIHEELEVMFHMYNLNPNDPIVRLVTGVMEEMRLSPNIRPSGGGTDANAMRLKGIDCVVVGMSTNEMHTIKEYVVVPDLVDTARFCERVITVKV
ncbi:MAG: M20/M25/M40 family metallo-hydrolase [Dehalococcoidia bacterium]|jgi:tripeptide aminopeptidase|nr:M20/M25/M40 family metallo-hydrolase [Dehalococcoidia bacterium]MDP6227264.1 M20/M25/M40 family metallo-hydrolase [Dehalococcoidia bacterium]MDP7083334.1 M20/M25/M40 family metallo-hydrolase [Dehalococcoidia bacterium]MDP7200363.1 M20/M25/M40 family metallo-hydrolase [Dehalococcoidia bacterium]MDP7511503.1 M20/M25/M40 family metallo-hydrolase [Dehalococcoidia bacterium]